MKGLWMANYYTTRFNPSEWPPVSGAIPPGVVMEMEEMHQQGRACCSAATLRSAEARLLEEPWAYRTRYRLGCPEHGETDHETVIRLDWISPNEYLLIRT
ncbi:MAG: hypothetical protein KY468_10490 [Armatimonadetes bacterium]|nr:hypothetical protein [Armatimonadota bacterium]